MRTNRVCRICGSQNFRRVRSRDTMQLIYRCRECGHLWDGQFNTLSDMGLSWTDHGWDYED